MNVLAKIIIIFWISAFLVKYFLGGNPYHMDLTAILSAPNSGDWFGKDDYGRSIFFRLIDGFKNSVEIIFFVKNFKIFQVLVRNFIPTIIFNNHFIKIYLILNQFFIIPNFQYYFA